MGWQSLVVPAGVTQKDPPDNIFAQQSWVPPCSNDINLYVQAKNPLAGGVVAIEGVVIKQQYLKDWQTICCVIDGIQVPGSRKVTFSRNGNTWPVRTANGDVIDIKGPDWPDYNAAWYWDESRLMFRRPEWD
jgi:hypothetical protein